MPGKRRSEKRHPGVIAGVGDTAVVACVRHTGAILGVVAHGVVAAISGARAVDGSARLASLIVLSSVAFRTRQGTATAGLDYVSKSGSLHFRRGQRLATVSVELIDDDEPEDDEVFFVELYEPADGASLGRYPVADVTIIDDDGPAPTLTFATAASSVDESAGMQSLAVQLDEYAPDPVTVDVTLGGTASAGAENRSRP